MSDDKPKQSVAWVVFVRYSILDGGGYSWWSFKWRPRNICDTRERARMAAKRWRATNPSIKTKEKKYTFTGTHLIVDYDMPERRTRKRISL